MSVPPRTSGRLVQQLARHIPSRPPSGWRGPLIAVPCVAAGALLRFLIEPVAHGHIPVVLFYPFIIIASVWGGTLSGLTASVLALMIARYFWLPPPGSLAFNIAQLPTVIGFSVACGSVIFMAALFRALIRRHVEDEERAVLLAHEMKHRANNLLGILRAISEQTARSANSVAEYRALLGSRLAVLERAQHVVSETPDASVDLGSLLRGTCEPFGVDRFMFEGPAVAVPQFLATSCALLFHELGTNATKYGALSVPGGMISVTWIALENEVQLQWQEIKGPSVVAPTRSGFGSRLIKTAFPPEYGSVAIAFNPVGVHCAINFKL